MFQALEGFAFLLNHEGKVDYVTDNVSQFIKFTKDEILGKSIYSIIHPNDHGKFSSCLLPTSISNRNQGGSGGGSSQQPKNRSFNCSMLMKSGDDFDESVADNKERDYEEVQVCRTMDFLKLSCRALAELRAVTAFLPNIFWPSQNFFSK